MRMLSTAPCDTTSTVPPTFSSAICARARTLAHAQSRTRAHTSQRSSYLAWRDRGDALREAVFPERTEVGGGEMGSGQGKGRIGEQESRWHEA